MIDTKFIHSTYVWVVRSPHCGSSSYWCQNTLTHEKRWFYTEEIEEKMIKPLPPSKKVKITNTHL